jgi:peptidyl-prolyl cis-trans isomerase-like 4
VSEEIDDMDGKTSEQIEEEMREKEARERALVLEMIGDIPDADVKPPENVLFVCKLNPVTREDDLEVIFSRFGHILSCEVIRDSKTNESLQYAFIEFEKAEDCEKAYFKMDNVLIDDRRIHVDFSQSVSKIKWYGKGKGVTYVNDYKEDKRNPKDKFTIKESAFGQRLDSKYDYVYDNSHDRSDRKKDSDYRSRDKYRPHQRSNKSRSRSRDRERKSRYHTNEKESHHKSKGHHKRSRHSSSPERKSSSHSRHHNKSRRH